MFLPAPVILILLFLISRFAFAQESLAETGEPGQQKYRLGTIYADDPSVRFTDSNFYIPVYQQPGMTFGVGARGQKYTFKDIPTPTGGVRRDNLYDTQFSGNWQYREDENKVWGATVSYGSVSDDPFSGGDVTAMSVTATHRIKRSETSQWIWLLNYSNNRIFLNNVPLPGFAATFVNEEKTSGGMWGFPFVLYWMRPSPKAFASIFVLIPAAVRAQAGYLFYGPLQANAKFEFGQQSFLIAGRARREDQLYYQSSKALVSLKAFLGAQTFFELEVGRGFNRSFFSGRSVFDRDPGNIDLPSENFFAANIQLSL